MKIAAYCRVSTDKADQLNSLEAQKEFFSEYTQRTGDVLVKLYADEGISGTKIKNRKEFLRMMADAEKGMFDMVVVKDISRFARNTVDLLLNVRKLNALGIETQFLTANMTSMGNSEFVLTIFGALAQEESANTSKRVKFGKKLNAEKGRVPNIVYGYDKTIGDYFNLEINKEESKVVKQIYKWYTEEGYGAAKISNMLNEKGYRTKRNCKWSQNAICRILTNEIYTGKIINGKQEISDFLTGQRREKDETEWLVVERPELRLYYEGFGNAPADHCLAAETDGHVVGAVWTRIMNDYGHVDDETPSFAISLLPEYRRQGLGTRMMRGMLSLLKEQGYRQASLAVQKANYAVRMYKNVGFEITNENDEEYIMVCRL